MTLDNLARGAVPSDFHVHLRRYDLASLPHSPDELAAWIQARWLEKDQLLDAFYSNPNEPQRAFPVATKNHHDDEPQHQQREARSKL